MFDADRPIQKSEQDCLGRTTFAKYLARCIIDHKNPESLVIGLYGGWGTGKTSLINLMLEELNLASSNMFDEERPVILNFSPWSYSGQNQLIYAFFRRFSSVIRQFEYMDTQEKNKIIQLLELYISFFTHQPVPHALRTKKSWISKLLHPFMKKEETYAWESGRDLTQVKAELNELLTKQKRKFIIVIDNISRIENTEIKQIFQIVKSMGDYINTVYLLSIDKDHITRALGEEGKDYLEKIIQLPFDVPPISQQDLENILFNRLKNIVRTVHEENWDADYWADIYYSSVKFFFKDFRDITRYINTLSFGFERIKDTVNPVDFFALTALQVFEPAIFYGIRDNKDLFTDLVNTTYQLDTKKSEEDKIRCDEILNRLIKFPKEIILALLTNLFPRLKMIYQNTKSATHSEALARKNKRICSADVFDIYFRLSIASGYISSSEMTALLTATRSEEDFSHALLRLNQDERITKFLDLLDGSEVSKIPTENIRNVMNALMDSGDLFPMGETSLVSFNTAMRIHRIFNQLLKRLSTSEERFEIFKDAISKSKNSLYILVNELMKQTSADDQLFTYEQLQQLKKLTSEKIKDWANRGRLIEHPKLIDILFAWKEWSRTEECMNYIAEIAKTDRGLVAFLCAALKNPIDEAMAKLERNPSWEESLKNIDSFISSAEIMPHANELFEDLYFEKLREREQLAILIFLNLTKSESIKIIPKTTV